MNILIKGLEMPMRGDRQRLTIQICSDGSVYVVKSCTIYDAEYSPKWTAKELPPHGRLIDADELKKKYPHNTDWDYPVNTNSVVNEDIDEAPTIIEAEVEEWK